MIWGSFNGHGGKDSWGPTKDSCPNLLPRAGQLLGSYTCQDPRIEEETCAPSLPMEYERKKRMSYLG